MWQDNVISAVTILFGIFLIPQLNDVLFHGVVMNPITTFGTAAGMIVLTACYITLNLRLSAVITGLEAIPWFLLGVFSQVHL